MLFLEFLFKISGSRELVIFWLRVQASWTSLCIFQEAFRKDPRSKGRETTNRAVESVRDAQKREDL